MDRLKNNFLEVHGDCTDTEKIGKAASATQNFGEGASAAKQPRIDQFAVSTSTQRKANFDKDGRFVFANNITFQAVESNSFVVVKTRSIFKKQPRLLSET